MRALLGALVVVAVAGCAGAPVTVPEQLFTDDAFAAGPRPPVDEDIFALSPEMQQFASARIAGEARRYGKPAALAAVLKRELRLEYTSGSTQSAAETFERRSGNCMSLVILAGAFARYMGVPVTYQNVYGQDTWSRVEGIAFLSTHVNIKLGPAGSDNGQTIDFIDSERWERIVKRSVDELTLRAMYLNNRAAESLAMSDINAAYWWVRAAIEAAPDYTNAINTLGIVYLRRGQLRDAEQTLRYVVEREPANARAMANLSRVLQRQGHPDEAREWQARAAAIEPYPPFYFLDRGQAAIERGDYEAAQELLTKELRRMPYYDEVHFALAVAEARLGKMRAARNHLELAQRYSTVPDRRDVYGAKLAKLKALGSP
jgi:Tfp pilus assembly protein PilF